VKNLSIDKMDKGGTKHTGVPVKTLKKLLKKAGLKVSGKKATLTRRAKKARLMKGGLFGLPNLGISKRITDFPNLGIRKRITDALPDHGVLGNAKIITQDEADENSDYATTKNFSEDQPKSKLAKVFAQKKGLFKGSPEQIAAEAEREKNRFVTNDIIDSFKKVEGNQQKLKEAFKKEYGYELDDPEMMKDYVIYKSHNVWEGSLEQRGARAAGERAHTEAHGDAPAAILCRARGAAQGAGGGGRASAGALALRLIQRRQQHCTKQGGRTKGGVAQELQQEGLAVVAFGQGYASMSPAAKAAESLVLQGRLWHDGHPVQRWCWGNAVIESDSAGNIKPSKSKSTEKIDLCVAGVMAIARAQLGEVTGTSVYEGRGLGML
jgi:hypothetical protein